MRSLFIFIGLGIFLWSCGPKITTRTFTSRSPLDYRQGVVVYSIEQPVPGQAIYIGTVKAGDSGFTTENDYSKVIGRLKEEARKSGANLIKISKHKNPDFWSTAHHISAELYYCDSTLMAGQKKQTTALPADYDYALLHIYRLGGAGALVGYDVHLGDSLIGRAKPGWKETLQITITGYNTLWAKTESKTELTVTMEKGKEYYVRCGIQLGIMIGRPVLELVNSEIGQAEFKAIH